MQNMKLTAEVGVEKHDVEITRSDKTVCAVVNGREYLLEVSEPEPGIFLFKRDGRILEASVSAEGSDHKVVRLRGSEFDIRIFDPKRLRGASAGDAHSEGMAEIRTAMPGKVVRILSSSGSEVEKGDGIMVVEAMKMQNEVKSPKSGTVREIRVAEGVTVSAGEILAIIE